MMLIVFFNAKYGTRLLFVYRTMRYESDGFLTHNLSLPRENESNARAESATRFTFLVFAALCAALRNIELVTRMPSPRDLSRLRDGILFAPLNKIELEKF